MDIGIISLLVSGVVAALHGLQFLESKTQRKEQSENRFAKAEGVSSELVSIRADITENDSKIDDHERKISALQTHAAVCINKHENTEDEMDRQLRTLERIANKLEGTR